MCTPHPPVSSKARAPDRSPGFCSLSQRALSGSWATLHQLTFCLPAPQLRPCTLSKLGALGPFPYL